MRVFKLKPTVKTTKWLKKTGINLNAMQNALCTLYADIIPSSRFNRTNLVLQVDYCRDSSSYIFGTNKIYLCSDPDILAKTRKQKIFVIFLHFLHEFRHWMQSQVLGIKDSQLHYTEDDMDRNTRKYYYDRFEVDARKFERKYVRKFMKYYMFFKKAS